MNSDLEIIRYTEGVMEPKEKENFLAQTGANSDLRASVETEEQVQRALQTDAELINRSEQFETSPGAPLIERLTATIARPNSKLIYYVIAGAVVIGLSIFFFLGRGNHEQNLVKPPELQSTPQNIPAEISAPSPVPELRQGQPHPKAQSKDSGVKSPVQNQKNIDLDQDIKGKPKVFTDPKGHMPINK
jgi:hypothetical protein